MPHIRAHLVHVIMWLLCVKVTMGQETRHSGIVLCTVRTSPHSDPSTEAANCTTGEHRLVNGPNPLEGRVEICINNAWGTVCSTAFSENEAEVICRNLGLLPSGKVLMHISNACIQQYCTLQVPRVL